MQWSLGGARRIQALLCTKFMYCQITVPNPIELISPSALKVNLGPSLNELYKSQGFVLDPNYKLTETLKIFLFPPPIIYFISSNMWSSSATTTSSQRTCMFILLTSSSVHSFCGHQSVIGCNKKCIFQLLCSIEQVDIVCHKWIMQHFISFFFISPTVRKK